MQNRTLAWPGPANHGAVAHRSTRSDAAQVATATTGPATKSADYECLPPPCWRSPGNARGLSPGLIHPRSGASSSSRRTTPSLVATYGDLPRTPVNRLGKRVGATPQEFESLILRHPDQYKLQASPSRGLARCPVSDGAPDHAWDQRPGGLVIPSLPWAGSLLGAAPRSGGRRPDGTPVKATMAVRVGARSGRRRGCRRCLARGQGRHGVGRLGAQAAGGPGGVDDADDDRCGDTEETRHGVDVAR